jgi:hypothetical protein
MERMIVLSALSATGSLLCSLPAPREVVRNDSGAPAASEVRRSVFDADPAYVHAA